MLLPLLLAWLLSKLVVLISSVLLSVFSLICGRGIPSYETPSNSSFTHSTVEKQRKEKEETMTTTNANGSDTSPSSLLSLLERP